MEDFVALILLSMLIVVVLALILLPTLIAKTRKCRNLGAIFLINILGVWIGIGWIVALIWSFTDDVELS